MMGWLIFATIAVATAAVLVAIRFPMRLWTVPATAIALGGTGYSLQGSPWLKGHPVDVADRRGELDPDEVMLRNAMFGEFTFARQYFAVSDAMTASGAYDTAVIAMQGGTNKAPGDASLWTGLGTALANHDHGVSPASKFAFDRAMKLWPQHPGPPFFTGLAYVRMGELAEARPYWARAVALAPEKASYREVLRAQLDWLDRRIAENAARQQQMLNAPQQ